MFCPGCGHYLNSNILVCPYCGVETRSQSKTRSKMIDRTEKMESADSEYQYEDSYSDDMTNNNGKLVDFGNRYIVVGLLASIIGIISLFLPWTYWSGAYIINYNAIDLLSLTWEGNFEMCKYSPFLVGISCCISLPSFILLRKYENLSYVAFACGLFGMLSTLIFCIGTFVYSDLHHYMGIGIGLVCAVFIMLCGQRIFEGDIKKRKPKRKKS